jgi:hypothetical protein
MSTCGIDAIVISFINYTNCPMPDLEATDKPCCPQRPTKKKETGMSATPAGTHHFWGNPSVSCVQSWVSKSYEHRQRRPESVGAPMQNRLRGDVSSSASLHLGARLSLGKSSGVFWAFSNRPFDHLDPWADCY